MSDDLNMTEILTLVQDFITSDGMIKSEQRKFYQVLRTVLSTHDGTFSDLDIQQFLLLARTETLELSDEDYSEIYNAVMERYTITQRLEDEALLEKELEVKAKLRMMAESKAKEEAKLILGIEKRNLWALNFLINISVENQNWEDAIAWTKQLQKITGKKAAIDEARFDVYKGLDCLEGGDIEKAKSLFKKAIKMNPELALSYRHLGDVFEQTRDLVKALENWEKFALKDLNGGTAVYAKIESALFDLGRFSEVEKFYRKILQYNPSNFEATIRLANVLEEKGEILKYDIWNWSEQYYVNKPVITKCFNKKNLPKDELPELGIINTNDYVPKYTAEAAKDLFNTSTCPHGQVNDKDGFPTNPKGKSHCIYVEPTISYDIKENGESVQHVEYSKKVAKTWKNKKVYKPDNGASLYHPKPVTDKQGRKFYPVGSVWRGKNSKQRPKDIVNYPESSSMCGDGHGSQKKTKYYNEGPEKETILVSFSKLK